MGDEPAGLLDGGAAVVEEVISAARDAGTGGALPVLAEQWIGLIAALGRLDESKADAIGLRGLPIDRCLEFRHVNAVDAVVLRRSRAEILRVAVAEIGALRRGGGRAGGFVGLPATTTGGEGEDQGKGEDVAHRRNLPEAAGFVSGAITAVGGNPRRGVDLRAQRPRHSPGRRGATV